VQAQKTPHQNLPMKILNIKTSRIKNRINLVFSDENYLPFFIDDVVRLSLTKHSNIDELKLNQIKSSSLYYLGKEYALRQIAISPKTEKILSFKLKIFLNRSTKKFKLLSGCVVDPIVRQIIDELKVKKYLNESDFVAYFIKKNKSKSVIQIKYLLEQQGVNVSNLKISPTNEIETIKNILTKKKLNQKLLSDYNYKNKLYASLFRKGFTISTIKAAIDEYLSLQ